MDYIRACIRNKRGVTLIELLIAMALVSTVIALGYSLYHFSTTSFSREESTVNIQQNLRLAFNHITSEVRFAYHVEVLPESTVVPAVSDIADGISYIFINNDGNLELRKKDASLVYPDTLLDSNNYSLLFSNNSSRLLGIKVGNTANNITIQTQIIILNLTGDIIGDEGTVIRFKK